MANNPPEPVCKAILLCQKTILEADTNIISLIGLFDGFGVGESMRSGHAELFCQINEAQGKYRISVEVQDLADGTAVAGTDGIDIEVDSPLASTNVIIPIPPIPFPHLGEYDFVVFANDSEIDRHKFAVQANA